MQYKIIIENNPCSCNTNILHEHGFCLYFEIDNKKWLLDCGASSKFINNCHEMNIAVEEIDYLLLSHGHNDHTGGLRHFVEINTKAKIVVSENIIGNDFYTCRKTEMTDIGFRKDVFDLAKDRIIYLNKNTQISDSVVAITSISCSHPTPKANSTLFKNTDNDNFDHEIVFVVQSEEGYTILSSCSHNGILNTLDTVSENIPKDKIIAYIGGGHFPNGNFETVEDIKSISRTILKNYHKIVLATGHCTGTDAMNAIRETIGDRLIALESGKIIAL